MTYKHTFALALLFLAASCGGKQSPVKLKLANNFIMVNNNFAGGIIIQGVGITNPSYTFDVGADNGDAIDMTLPDGDYTIRVMAYETAAGTPYPFMGNPKCAVQNITVSGMQTFEIQTTTTQCANDAFATTNYRHSSGPKPLVFHSCGSLEGLSNPSVLNTNVSTYSFCKNNYPPELGKAPLKYRIRYLHQINGSFVGSATSSGCETVGPQSLRYPTKFPLRLETFETPDCTDTPKVYSLVNGIEGTTTFTKHLTQDGGQNFLTVFNGTNNGTGFGSFHTETPLFTCSISGNENSCGKVMSNTGGQPAIVIDRGEEWQRIRLPYGLNCGQVSTFGVVQYKTNSCATRNGYSYIEIRASSAGGLQSFTWGGTNVPVKVGNNAAVYGASYQFSRERKLYQTLKSVVGFNYASIGNHNEALQDNYFTDGKESLGFLSPVADLLSPFHLGGLFFSQGCSTSPLNGSIPFNLNYHSSYSTTPEIVNAILTDPPVTTPPAFIRNTAGPQGTNPVNNVDYHRRFILQKIAPPALPKTFLTLDLACDGETSVIRDFTSGTQYRIGRLERQIEYMDYVFTTTRKEILHYNVSSILNSRFDYYGEVTKSNVSVVQQKEKLFYRAEKFGGTSDAAFRVSGMTYKADRVSSAFDETLERFEIDGEFDPPATTFNNGMTYTYKEILKIKKTASSLGSIFDDQAFTEYLNNVYYGHKDGHATLDEQAKVASHKDGNFVQVSRTPSGISLNGYIGGTFATLTDNSTLQDLLVADISPNGSYGIVVAVEGINVRVYRFDGTSWQSALLGSSPNSYIINDMKAAIKDDGTFTVGIIVDGPTNDDWVYFAQMGFAASTFGTWNDPFSGDGDREAFSLTITKSSTEFFAAIASVDHNAFRIELHWCDVTSGGSCTATNDLGADVRITGNSTAAFFHLQSRYTTTGGGQIEINWVDTTVTPRLLLIDSSAQTRDGDSWYPTHSVVSYGASSISSYYGIQLQINISNYSGYGHAYVNVPFNQPTMNASTSKFQMNFISLKDSVMNSVFTSPTTFQNTVGVP